MNDFVRNSIKTLLVSGLFIGFLACSGDQPVAPDTDPTSGAVTGLKGSGDAPPLPVPDLSTTELRPANGGLNALLFHSDFGSTASFEASLMATGMFSNIDETGMSSTPPSPGFFAPYDCVIVYTNNSPPNPSGNGDAVGAYVDAGGNVIISTYALTAPENPWEMMGKIMDPGYNPLALRNVDQTDFPRSLDFGSAMTGHPILDGVSDFTYGGNSNYVSPTLDPGATLIGSDNFGDPLIALNTPAGNVVGINLFPGSFSKTDGVYRTYANACGLGGETSCAARIASARSSLDAIGGIAERIGDALLDALAAGNQRTIDALRRVTRLFARFGLLDAATEDFILSLVDVCED